MVRITFALCRVGLQLRINQIKVQRISTSQLLSFFHVSSLTGVTNLACNFNLPILLTNSCFVRFMKNKSYTCEFLFYVEKYYFLENILRIEILKPSPITAQSKVVLIPFYHKWFPTWLNYWSLTASFSDYMDG